MGDNTVSDGDDAASETLDLFQEPPDYYQPEKPATFTHHKLRAGPIVPLRLVGHSPLWGHLLWNAGQIIAEYLERNADVLVKGKNVLELGAGAGLPSLTAAFLGASRVVVTDYPEPELIANLQYNIDHCDVLPDKDCIVARGFLWGNPTDALKQLLNTDNSGFDLLILADILFNHSEHAKLVHTVRETLQKRQDSVALVFFTPYRPWLFEKDLHFFDLAREEGLVTKKVLEHTMDKVMFEKDPGDETLRRTVFGYELRWNL